MDIKAHNSTSTVILTKGTSGKMCNHQLWVDEMDKYALENRELYMYWKNSVVPRHRTPVYEELVVDGAGAPILDIHGQQIWRPVQKYRSAAVGKELWKKDSHRVELNKTEYDRALPKFLSRLLKSIGLKWKMS